MKNLKIVTLTACIALMLSLMLFSSCSDDDNSSGGASAGAPVVESVMPSGYDEAGNVLPLTPVTIGDPKNYYIIHGKGLLSTQKVYFNDFDTYFKPVFVTDTDIIILIDENTPYADASNELKVVTNNGTVVYPFMIAPPAPTFNGFNFINCAAGDEVIIKGKFFLNPVVTLAKLSVNSSVPLPVFVKICDKATALFGFAVVVRS